MQAAHLNMIVGAANSMEFARVCEELDELNSSLEYYRDCTKQCKVLEDSTSYWIMMVAHVDGRL